MAAFDPKALKTHEWGIVGGAALAFIGLFFHAWSASSKGTTVLGQKIGGISYSVSGWHFFWLWAPVLLLLAAAGLIALEALKPEVIPAQIRAFTTLIPLGVGVLTVVIVLIRWLTYPSDSGLGISAGASFGTYLILIAAVVATVFAFLNFTSHGGKIQDFKQYLPKGTGTTPPADDAV